VLVAVDLTPSSDRVLGRVALLPLAADARLTLLHVVPRNLPARARRLAKRDATKALAEEVRHLAKSLPRTVRIKPVTKIGSAVKEIAACARSVNAELVVMGRGGGRRLRDVYLGSTAGRVIRRGDVPVLVVRLPARATYSRPAVALGFDQAAHAVLDLAVRMIPPPRPRVAIIHAFDAPYPRLAYPSLSTEETEEVKRELQLEVASKLANLIATSFRQLNIPRTDAPAWTHIRYGAPRIVIEKAVKKAATDLLMLGTRGYSGVAYLFLGTVAGEVLRDVTCDVLVVPPRPRRKSRSSAVDRTALDERV
jgi:nucleotide-binding universal stress UspA family protein